MIHHLKSLLSENRIIYILYEPLLIDKILYIHILFVLCKKKNKKE